MTLMIKILNIERKRGGTAWNIAAASFVSQIMSLPIMSGRVSNWGSALPFSLLLPLLLSATSSLSHLGCPPCPLSDGRIDSLLWLLGNVLEVTLHVANTSYKPTRDKQFDKNGLLEHFKLRAACLDFIAPILENCENTAFDWDSPTTWKQAG